MKSRSLFHRTLLCFFFVLIHSALTIHHAFADDCLTADQSVENVTTEFHFDFDGKFDNSIKYSDDEKLNGRSCFVSGLKKLAFRVGADGSPACATVAIHKLKKNSNHDFTVEFWIRTTADSNQRFILLSQKKIPNNSLETQKNKGWAFGVSNGTWSWNIGSGNRRLNYERDNGKHMPVNDGRWHQLVMTHDHSKSIIRLFYDGVNWVTYNLADKDEFTFANEHPFTIGWEGNVDSSDSFLLSIKQGKHKLQELVDQFNQMGLGKLSSEELVTLVVSPEQLVRKKRADFDNDSNSPKKFLSKTHTDAGLNSIKKLLRQLSANPYTVHQVADFMEVAPMLKLYRLNDETIEIDARVAEEFARQERLSRPAFDIDELSILDRAMDSREVLQRYSKHFQPAVALPKKKLTTLNAASFNIHHGGKHETIAEDGWDSREAIAELIRRENIDIVMMQETYSSGDFIAAELGYYFATTVDWDYLNQGANISILSRYPIEEIMVPPASSFMNVAARVSISETQDMYAMSNWYGMNNFKDVFEFHTKRFSQSGTIPILFAGDFNAVPHTDGGKSEASTKLLEAGFRDAYRETYPDAEKFPGHTHVSGSRIDQLYYKGDGLVNDATTVLSTWPSKFPSDHYIIKSNFKLDYITK